MEFNPNYLSFGHVAVGYRCGFLRILKVDDEFKEEIRCAEKLISTKPSSI